jgi:hypothetical protein
VSFVVDRAALLLAAAIFGAGLLGFGPFHGAAAMNALSGDALHAPQLGVSRAVRGDEIYGISPTIVSYLRSASRASELDDAVSGFLPIEALPIGPLGSFRAVVTPLSWPQILPLPAGRQLAIGYALLSAIGVLCASWLGRRLRLSRCYANAFAVALYLSPLWQAWLVSGIGFGLSAAMVLAVAMTYLVEPWQLRAEVVLRAGFIGFASALVLYSGYPPAVLAAAFIAIAAFLLRLGQVGWHDGGYALRAQAPIASVVVAAVLTRYWLDERSFFHSLQAVYLGARTYEASSIARAAWVPELFPAAAMRFFGVRGELINVCEDARIAFVPLAIFVLAAWKRATLPRLPLFFLAVLLAYVWLGVPIGLARFMQARLAMASGAIGLLVAFVALEDLAPVSRPRPWRAALWIPALVLLAWFVTARSPFGRGEAIVSAALLGVALVLAQYRERVAVTTFAIAQAIIVSAGFNPLVSHAIFDAERPAMTALRRAAGDGLYADLSRNAGNVFAAFSVRTLFGRHDGGAPQLNDTLLAMRRDRASPRTEGYCYFSGHTGHGTSGGPDTNAIDVDPCDARLRLLGVSVASIDSADAAALAACGHWRPLDLATPGTSFFALDGAIPTQAIVPATPISDVRTGDGYDRVYRANGAEVRQRLRYGTHTLRIELEGQRLEGLTQVLMHEAIYERSVTLDGIAIPAAPMADAPLLKRVSLAACHDRCTIVVTYD